MTDTTDTARALATLREMQFAKERAGMVSATSLKTAADALERLAAENAELRTKLDAAVQMLAGWCRAVAENGTGWDDWDEH